MKKNKYQLIDKNTGNVMVSGEAAVISHYIGRPVTALYGYAQHGYVIHDKYIAVCMGKILDKIPKKRGIGRPRKDPKVPYTHELYEFKSTRCILHHDHEGRLMKTTFLPL